MTTDKGEPIPETRLLPGGGTCSFCRDAKHFGWCDAMRAYNDEAAKRLHPQVNPLVRN